MGGARVYGSGSARKDPNSDMWYIPVSKTTIMNSVYRDETNFASDSEPFIRNIYAPGDFSDLHMKVVHETGEVKTQDDYETFPVLQGYVSGVNDVSENRVTLTFLFNVVIEY